MEKSIAVLTSGGDAPGMNAAIRAVVRTGIAYECHVFGVRNGYHGLINGQFERMSTRDVGGILQRGGTILGSARSEEFMTVDGRSEAIRNFQFISHIAATDRKNDREPCYLALPYRQPRITPRP